MSAPKHLWSGDWEAESSPLPTSAAPGLDPAAPWPEAAAADPGRPWLQSQPAPDPAPEARPPQGTRTAPSTPRPSTPRPRTARRPRRPRRSRRRGTVLGLAAVLTLLVLTGVTLALTHDRSRDRPAVGAAQPSTPLAASPTVPQAVTPTGPPAAASTVAQPAPEQIGPSYRWLGMEMSQTPAGLTVSTVSLDSVADHAGVNPGDVIAAVDRTPVGTVAGLDAAVHKLVLRHVFGLTVERGLTPVQINATLVNRPVRQR